MPDLPPLDFAGFVSPHYTQVPDEIFDRLLPYLTEAELKVLLYIVRRTFGWKKDSDAISLTQLTEGITRKDGTRLDYGSGMSRPAVLRGIKGLEARGIIAVTRAVAADGEHETTVYRLCMGDDRNVTPAVTPRNYPSNAAESTVVTPRDPQETPVQDTAHKNGSGRNLARERTALAGVLRYTKQDVTAGLAAWDAAGQPPYSDWLQGR